MRRWSVFVLAFVLVALAPALHASAQTTTLVPGGLTALPAQTTGPNLLANGGFETVAGSLPTGWTGGTAWNPDQLVKKAGFYSYRRGTGAATASQSVDLKKGLYKLSAWVKAENLGGSSSGVRLQLDFRPGGINAWVPTKTYSGTFDWQLVQLGPIAVNSDRKASVLLENYGNPGGTAWFDDVKLERIVPPAVEAFLLYPNYRGMLFDDQSQTMKVDVTVTPPGDDMARYKVSVSLAAESSGAVVATRTFPASAHFVADLDGSAMQPGSGYLLKVALVDGANSAPVYTYPAYRVSKVPGSRRTTMNVSFDAKNRVLLRGTPRFVLGVYDSGSSYGTSDSFWESQLWSPTGDRRMDGMKINMYLNYWFGHASADAMKALMANLQKHGVMYLQTGNCFARGAAEPNNFLIDTSDGYVQDIGAHGGSAGYYTIDECESNLVPGAFAQYQRLKKLDPDSLTFSALLGNPPDVFLWRDAADIISTDPYPMYGAEPAGGYYHRSVADWTGLAREAVKGSRPFMTVLQFFKFTSLGRWPKWQEMRNHAYMAIVEGARGLWWWSLGDNALKNVCSGWCTEKTQYMANLKAVVNEIAELEPALIADDANGALTANSNPAAIKTKVKVVNGKGYVFAYNATNASVTVTFGWNTAPGTVTVNAENRTIPASGSSFTDTFGPYQAHVYLIGSGGTGGTPPPPPPGGSTVTAGFTNPAANATVSGTITVTMTGSGGSGTGYTYTLAVDGRTVYAGANPTFSWNTTATADGSHVLAATVRDSAGATGTATRTLTVANGGTTPPPPTGGLSVSITAPKANATVSGKAWATMWVNGASTGSKTYALSLGGKAVGTSITTSSGPVSVQYDTTGAANGSQPLTATVTEGGKSGSSSVTVLVSNGGTTPPPGAPTLTFTAPAAGATVRGTTTVSMAASGGSGTGYAYTLAVDGRTVYSGAAGSYAWNTTAVADGARMLTATVRDSAGATATATRGVTVANTTTPPPTTGSLRVSITAPAANTTVSGEAWATLWVGGAAAGSKTYTLAINGITLGTSVTTSSGPVSFRYDTRKVADGARALTATVRDSAGATGTTSIPVNVRNGTATTPPPTGDLTAGFTSPAAGATVRGTTTVGMSVSGSTATTRTFTLRVDGTVVSTQTVSGTTASYGWNTGLLTNGTHTLALTVTDSAGRTGMATRSVTVSNTVTAPTGTLRVIVTAPSAGATVRGTVWATVWVEGAAAGSKVYTLSVGGVTRATQTTTSSGPVSLSWPTTAVDNGGRTLGVTVRDADGKVGTASVNVTVAN